MRTPKTAPKANPRPRLAPNERLYLRLLQQMEEENELFSDQSITALAGWRSVEVAWAARDGLLRKGYLQDGRRLATIECPIITNAGLTALKPAPKPAAKHA